MSEICFQVIMSLYLPQTQVMTNIKDRFLAPKHYYSHTNRNIVIGPFLKKVLKSFRPCLSCIICQNFPIDSHVTKIKNNLLPSIYSLLGWVTILFLSYFRLVSLFCSKNHGAIGVQAKQKAFIIGPQF